MKEGANKEELRGYCDQYASCVGIDWGNYANGYLAFISEVTAKATATSVPGSSTLANGCKSNCKVTSAIPLPGECWLKQQDGETRAGVGVQGSTDVRLVGRSYNGFGIVVMIPRR